MLRAQITAMHIPLNFYLKHTMEYIPNASVYTFVYFFDLNMHVHSILWDYILHFCLS